MNNEEAKNRVKEFLNSTTNIKWEDWVDKERKISSDFNKEPYTIKFKYSINEGWIDELNKMSERRFVISDGPLKWHKIHLWEQTKKQYLPKEKYQIVIQNIGEVIEEVKSKNWYQVYTVKSDGTPWIFGFAINQGVVEHFPIHQVNGRPAEEARQWLRHQKPVEVVKIAEQILK